MFNSLKRDDITVLLNSGVAEATRGNKDIAAQYFRQVLKQNANSETALLWLAWVTEDVYEAVNLLKRVIAINPSNYTAKAYLKQAQSRLQEFEIEQLISNSSVFNNWKSDPNNTTAQTKQTTQRLGEMLLNNGYITPWQLGISLNIQQDLKRNGNNKRIGEILVESGFIKTYQLTKMLEEMKKTVRFPDVY